MSNLSSLSLGQAYILFTKSCFDDLKEDSVYLLNLLKYLCNIYYLGASPDLFQLILLFFLKQETLF